jgi:uncharacterized protein involved in exopolysaccharide biosynthesis
VVEIDREYDAAVADAQENEKQAPKRKSGKVGEADAAAILAEPALRVRQLSEMPDDHEQEVTVEDLRRENDAMRQRLLELERELRGSEEQKTEGSEGSQSVEGLPYSDLKQLAADRGIDTHGMKKADLVKALQQG